MQPWWDQGCGVVSPDTDGFGEADRFRAWPCVPLVIGVHAVVTMCTCTQVSYM